MSKQTCGSTLYAQRKRQTWEKIFKMQTEMYQAGDAILGWAFRNRLLELVERLPKREQAAWRAQHLERLERVGGPVPESDENHPEE